LQEAVQVVSHVLPFRTNEYVLDQLIDWNNIPDDPIYRLTFPHRDMLAPDDYARCASWCWARPTSRRWPRWCGASACA
jgi:hypothetical protein